MRKWRDWLPRVLFESALIVLSVLLALALNQWSDERKQDERVTLAIAGVRAEPTTTIAR